MSDGVFDVHPPLEDLKNRFNTRLILIIGLHVKIEVQIVETNKKKENIKI